MGGSAASSDTQASLCTYVPDSVSVVAPVVLNLDVDVLSMVCLCQGFSVRTVVSSNGCRGRHEAGTNYGGEPSASASRHLQYTIIHRPCCLNVFMLYS